MKHIATFSDVHDLYVMAPSFIFAETEQENQKMRRELKTFRLLCKLTKKDYEPFLPKDILDYYLQDTVLSYYPIDYNEIVESIKKMKDSKGSKDPYVTSIKYENGEYGEGIYFQMSESFIEILGPKEVKEIKSFEDVQQVYKELEEKYHKLIKAAEQAADSDKRLDDLIAGLTLEEQDQLLRNTIKKSIDRLVETLTPEEKVKMLRDILK